MIHISLTYNADLIRLIMTSKGIWECITEDGADDPSKYHPDVDSEVWLRLENGGGDNIGLCRLQSINGITLQAHIAIMVGYRRQYGREAGEAILTFIYNHYEKCRKVIALIPDIYPHVQEFIEGFGFIKEGNNRLSHLKNGEICGQTWYGITRAEIAEVLNNGRCS